MICMDRASKQLCYEVKTKAEAVYLCSISLYHKAYYGSNLQIIVLS